MRYWRVVALLIGVLAVYGTHVYVVQERARRAQLESVRVWEEQFSEELSAWR